LIFLGFFGVFGGGELVMAGRAAGSNGRRWTVAIAWAIAL